MDWGLLTITRKGRIIPRQRQRMALPIYCYVFAAILNFILRFSSDGQKAPIHYYIPLKMEKKRETREKERE